MKSTVKTILIAGATALVVVAVAGLAFWWFSPMRELSTSGWAPGMWGPGGGMMGERGSFGPGMGIGPMGRGMMNQMHAMADVESEYEFLASMIPHHEEAVETATILRDNTNRREMREFAESIIRVQTREIEQMEAWLARWYPDRPSRAEYEPMMGEYEDLTGDRLDVAFLQDMIPHHMAAVMMSQQLIVSDLAEHDDVEDLARTIRDAQMEEIRRMSLWLREWN